MHDIDPKASAGSSLDDFLHEQGLYDSADQEAIKCVLSFQIEKALGEAEPDEKCVGQSDVHQPLRARPAAGPCE